VLPTDKHAVGACNARPPAIGTTLFVALPLKLPPPRPTAPTTAPTSAPTTSPFTLITDALLCCLPLLLPPLPHFVVSIARVAP